LKLGVKQKEKINFVAEGIEDKKEVFLLCLGSRRSREVPAYFASVKHKYRWQGKMFVCIHFNQGTRNWTYIIK
jgi:hypothetical protein